MNWKLLIFTLGIGSCFLLPLKGQTPEISADKPVNFSAETGILTAEGNAVYSDENVRVEANRIVYDRNQKQIRAEGNVRVTQREFRLVTEWLHYNSDTRQFSCGPYKAGYPPLFVSGDSFSGTREEIDFSQVTAYYREPTKASPSLSFNSATWIAGDAVEGSSPRFRLGPITALPLPWLRLPENAPSLVLDGEIGFRSKLGAYVRSNLLYPTSSQLSLGGNLELYSKRGVLIGPRLLYTREKADQNTHIELDTGWINDLGSSDLRRDDDLGNPIGDDRGFVRFRFRQQGPNYSVLAVNNWISDSEFYRDFRSGWFPNDPQPDNFAEAMMWSDHFIFSTFLRYPVNDSYGMVERLPEIRLEHLPARLGETSTYYQFAVTMSQYRAVGLQPGLTNPTDFPSTSIPGSSDPFFFDTNNTNPELERSSAINRLDAWARWTAPFHIRPWLQITPLVSGRWTHYSDSWDGTSLTGQGLHRWVGELGADMHLDFSSNIEWKSTAWRIDRLRHLSRLRTQYRWFANGDEHADTIAPFDRALYQSLMPEMDLIDATYTDTLFDAHRIRFGWENRWLAYEEKTDTWRELGSLHLYQDLFIDGIDGEDAWDSLYAIARLQPASWLSIDIEQKYRTEAASLEATRVGLSVQSANDWWARFFTEYVDGAIEQYGVDGRYWLNPEYSVIASLRYDAIRSSFTRQRYGIRRNFGRAWEIEVYVSLRSGDNRESDTSFGFRINLLR